MDTKTTTQTEQCGAYRHRGTQRCTKPATYDVAYTDGTPGPGARCQGHTRSWTPLAPGRVTITKR